MPVTKRASLHYIEPYVSMTMAVPFVSMTRFKSLSLSCRPCWVAAIVRQLYWNMAPLLCVEILGEGRRCILLHPAATRRFCILYCWPQQKQTLWTPCWTTKATRPLTGLPTTVRNQEDVDFFHGTKIVLFLAHERTTENNLGLFQQSKNILPICYRQCCCCFFSCTRSRGSKNKENEVQVKLMTFFRKYHIWSSLWPVIFPKFAFKSFVPFVSCLGHEGCLRILLENKLFGNHEGNSFNPLHCAL